VVELFEYIMMCSFTRLDPCMLQFYKILLYSNTHTVRCLSLKGAQ
jgi:hypothetical protein